MFDFNTLAEFSRADCVGISALMIPTNLVATSLTMIFTVWRRSALQVCLAAGIASIFALVMILHVFTWFMIGVVMPTTYILLWLGFSCLVANLGAILLRRRIAIAYNYTTVRLARDVVHLLVA